MPQLTLQQVLDLAVKHHQAGQFAEAQSLYRQLLNYHPDHPDSLHLLGVLEGQSGRFDEAIELIRRAVQLDPSNPQYLSHLGVMLSRRGRVDEAVEAHQKAVSLAPDVPDFQSNLGSALSERRRFEEAIGAFRRAIALRQDSFEAHYGLAYALERSGQIQEAIEAYEKALLLRPDQFEARFQLGTIYQSNKEWKQAAEQFRRAVELRPSSDESHFNLANALQELGQLEESIEQYQEALRLKPDFYEALNNLGNTLQQVGRREEAIEVYRNALKLRADVPETHVNIGNALMSLGRLDESIRAFEQALQLQPDYAQALNNLGTALRARGRIVEATAAYRRAGQLEPQLADAPNNLGIVLWEQGHLDESFAAYRRALELKPDFPEAWLNLGNAMKDSGRIDEAIRYYRKAIELKDDVVFNGNLLYALHFHPDYGPREIWKEHSRWNERFVRPLASYIRPHEKEPSAGRRLRIGYVSPDFRDHPVGRFMLPLLSNHDHENFEIFCYSDVRVEGAMTARLRQHADTWRDTLGLTDAKLAEQIRDDRIDILVDLTMHMEGNRLLTFARKPAPVQVTYLAYCSTTGAETIDYRFTDSQLDPVDDDSCYSEKSVRLRSYWCHLAPLEDVPVGPLPVLSAGQITFGCLNNFSKVSRPALAAWCNLMHRVPDSRMILHTLEGSHRKRIADEFAARGIGPERLEFTGYLPMDLYLQMYNRIDIGLDPFPYPGGTTTCDALWMGVPIVTWAGATAVSRGGASLLKQVGLTELIASSADQYIEIASTLAMNVDKLRSIRSSLRERMNSSPLMDALAFAKDVEGAYRRMWRVWCDHGDRPH